MKVQLLSHTQNPEQIVAAAAKLCYAASDIDTLLDGLTPEKSREFVQRLAQMGHESPIEHASFTFGIEGVSRSLLAQITRHRIASYSVQSQRYVPLRDFSYVTPPEIAADPEAQAVYDEMMRQQGEAYNKLANLLQQKHKNELLAAGKTEKEAARASEKMSIEDARFVLPNACDTKMIVTMNARSLLNFFHHRCCNRAQWEIRALAEEMFKLVYGAAPSLFAMAGPSCIKGQCPEEAMSCGRMGEMRDKYAGFKAGIAQQKGGNP